MPCRQDGRLPLEGASRRNHDRIAGPKDSAVIRFIRASSSTRASRQPAAASRLARYRQQPDRAAHNGCSAGHRRRSRSSEFQSDIAYRRLWTWTNLNTFSSHGGKLIFYHGVSDPWFSAKDTIDYYQRMSMANGGDAKVKDWSRLFLSPGMGHCSGGSAALDTFDMLSAAVNWVEKNTPPDAVTATGRAFPGRSRPLCPHPAHAQYNGTGDPENAGNYSCRP